MTKDFREDALELFAFLRVVTCDIRCRPSIDHGAQRFGFRSRMQLQEPVEPQEQQGLRSVFVSSAPHHRDMLGHHFAQHAAERPGLTQFGKSLFRIPRRQCPPDRHALLDIALIAQSGDGIAFDRADFHQAFEEPVNDAGAMQERGCRPVSNDTIFGLFGHYVAIGSALLTFFNASNRMAHAFRRDFR